MTLDALELEAARQDAGELLPDVCRLHRRTAVSDGGGGTTTTYQDAGELPCRIGPAGGGETGSPGSIIDDRTTHVVTLEALAAVTSRDRLEHAGTTYEVTAVRTRSLELVRRVEVRTV
jgi:hypothetical protein